MVGHRCNPAAVAVSVLTDFEEMAIYDCRIQPEQFDKASVARREYIGYRQHEEKWDSLDSTFSPRAVRLGDFDRYCATGGGAGRRNSTTHSSGTLRHSTFRRCVRSTSVRLSPFDGPPVFGREGSHFLLKGVKLNDSISLIRGRPLSLNKRPALMR
jgi:hypothetical protein